MTACFFSKYVCLVHYIVWCYIDYNWLQLITIDYNWLQLITIDYILLRNEIVLDFYKDLPVRRKETWSASTKSESGDFWCWKRRRGHEIETNGANWLAEFSDLQLLTSAVYLNSFQLILQLFFSLGFNLWFNWTNISAALTFETFLTGRMKGWKDMFF